MLGPASDPSSGEGTGLVGSAGDGTKSPISPIVLGDGALKTFPAEFRPEFVGEDQFRISTLPKQKIADPLFVAGPDQKVRIGDVVGP